MSTSVVTVQKWNLNLRLVVKLVEMPSKFLQLGLNSAKDRNIRGRIFETQPLHASTEIQSFSQLCNLLLILNSIITNCNSEFFSKVLVSDSHIILLNYYWFGINFWPSPHYIGTKITNIILHKCPNPYALCNTRFCA